MAKYTLNLDQLTNETFDITFKGSVIKVKKPPEELVYTLAERIKTMQTDGFDVEAGLKLTAEAVSRILSNNVDETEYSPDWVSMNIPLDARTAIMMAYMEFVTDISKNPN